MVRFLRFVVLLLALCLWLPAAPSAAPDKGPAASWEVHFSPKGDCTDAILREIGKARKTVLVQAYSFSSAPIAKALLNAHRRGVRVEVILDKSQRTQKYSSATFFGNTGISIRIDGSHAIAHNKVMIIDGETVITGSFNFTKSAEERNAENLLILQDKGLAAVYTRNWEDHARHSAPYPASGD